MLFDTVRGELFSLSLGCRDTLNIFLGCFLSFLREHICGALLLFGCRYYNVFLGGALSFRKACTFWLLFSFTFSFLSLSLIYFYWWFFASASETNRYSLSEFLLQQGQGWVCTGVGEGGIVNCREINKNTKANELTTLLQRLKNTGWSGDTEG